MLYLYILFSKSLYYVFSVFAIYFAINRIMIQYESEDEWLRITLTGKQFYSFIEIISRTCTLFKLFFVTLLRI